MQIKCCLLLVHHKSCSTFQIEFKRNYNAEEDKMRFKLYEETAKQINEHNIKFKKGLVPVEAGFNEYSDWTDVEKTKLLR